MNGIERFSRKQKAMAAEASAKKPRNCGTCRTSRTRDQAQNEELANRLAWQTRIFEDRRKSTSYVCDVPVLIEKRLFDLGSAIQNALNTDAPKHDRHLCDGAAEWPVLQLAGAAPAWRSASGRPAADQPSVPSRYQATLE